MVLPGKVILGATPQPISPQATNPTHTNPSINGSSINAIPTILQRLHRPPEGAQGTVHDETWEERLANRKAIRDATTQVILCLHTPTSPQHSTYAAVTRNHTTATEQDVNVANPKFINPPTKTATITQPKLTLPPI